MTGLRLYASAGALVFAFLLGWTVNGWRLSGDMAEANLASERINDIVARKEFEKSRNVSATLETKNVRARIFYRTITREVEKIVERPGYSGVCLDADGVSVVNRALAGEVSAPAEPPAAVP